MIVILLLYFASCFGKQKKTDSMCSVAKYFNQRIDHFNFLNHGNKTFKQRYLINDTSWDRGKGPIFYLTGGEQPITGCKSVGFMFDIAPKFHALVLLVEHRYYGTSLPFGKKSFKIPNIALLSIEQTLADHAVLLTGLKKKLKAKKCKVITFGVSYGGVLAAYMRMKYPHIVLGAIAASAPIYQLAGKGSVDSYFKVVTKDFHDASPKCDKVVRKAFAQLKKLVDSGSAGLKNISHNFKLCKELSSKADYDYFLRYVRSAFANAAMWDNSPSSSNANKVKSMCKKLKSASNPVSGLHAAVTEQLGSKGKCQNMHTKYVFCADPTGCGDGAAIKSWDYQACTEINLEGGTNGKTDMFPPLPFNASMRNAYCLKKWKVIPRRDWLRIHFGGSGDDIAIQNCVEKADVPVSLVGTNDVDTYTMLAKRLPDDAAVAVNESVLRNLSKTLVAVIIKGAAHHHDMSLSDHSDTPEVIAARKFEANCIRQWLNP